MFIVECDVHKTASTRSHIVSIQSKGLVPPYGDARSRINPSSTFKIPIHTDHPIYIALLGSGHTSLGAPSAFTFPLVSAEPLTSGSYSVGRPPPIAVTWLVLLPRLNDELFDVSVGTGPTEKGGVLMRSLCELRTRLCSPAMVDGVWKESVWKRVQTTSVHYR